MSTNTTYDPTYGSLLEGDTKDEPDQLQTQMTYKDHVCDAMSLLSSVQGSNVTYVADVTMTDPSKEFVQKILVVDTRGHVSQKEVLGVVSGPQAEKLADRVVTSSEVKLRIRTTKMIQEVGEEMKSYLTEVNATSEQVEMIGALVKRDAELKESNVEVAHWQSNKLAVKYKAPPQHEVSLVFAKTQALAAKMKARVVELVGDEGKEVAETIGGEAEAAVKYRGYTYNDPDGLARRFKHYHCERMQEFPDEMAFGFKVAEDVMSRVIIRGANDKAYPLDPTLITIDTLEHELRTGSAGEYSTLGVGSRTDRMLLNSVMTLLSKFREQAESVVTKGVLDAREIRPVAKTILFGKTEPKQSKDDGKGGVAPSDPRGIFNMSPVSYILAWVVYGDVVLGSKTSPCHGPGYGHTRGNAWKVENFVKKVFGENSDDTLVRDGGKVVCVDWEKYDASVKECLIKSGLSTFDKVIDTSRMSEVGKVMYDLIRKEVCDELLHKLIGHPSGIALFLHGTVPSGHYLTSALGTEMNNNLVVSFLVSEMVENGRLDVADSKQIESITESISKAVEGYLLSYGDNQAMSDLLFSEHGVEFSLERYESYADKLKMSLKPEETVVHEHISSMAFCNRKIVRLPEGQLILHRPPQKFLFKLASVPKTHDIKTKLYIRALMSDLSGSDPLAHETLTELDNELKFTPEQVEPMVERMPANERKELMERTGCENGKELSDMLARAIPSRAVALDLFRVKEDSGDKTPVTMITEAGAVTTECIKKMRDLSPVSHAFCSTKTYYRYLAATGQLGVLCERDTGYNDARTTEQRLAKVKRKLVGEMMMESRELPRHVMEELGVSGNTGGEEMEENVEYEF